jgi:recombination protein RecT
VSTQEIAPANPNRQRPVDIACSTIKSPAFKQNVAEALPPGIDPDRFIRTALTALQLKPEIANADRNSLYNAIVVAAQMKLLPDGREGALVVYNTKDGNEWVSKVQFQPMVQGIVKRFGEAGVLAYAASVYENELGKFRLWNDDTGQHVQHEPIVFGERGKFVGVYAVARTPDGRTFVEALGLEEIGKVQSASKSKDKQGNPVGPWKEWPDRMAQKSALHRLGRRVPVSDQDLAAVLNADAALYGDDVALGTPPPPAPVPEAQPEKPSGPRRPSGLQAAAAGPLLPGRRP